MSNWNLYVYESGGWVLDVALIPRPNEDLDITKLSTQQSIELADGSMGYITPENKSNRSDLMMSWVMKDETFRERVEEYIDNHDYIKIETHISGLEFIGRFKSVTAKWLVGEEPDEFTVSTVFARMEPD